MGDTRHRRVAETNDLDGINKDLLQSGTWTYNPKLQEFRIDPQAKKILLTNEEILSLESFLTLINPDDHENFTAFIEGLLSGRISRIDLNLHSESGRNHRYIFMAGSLMEGKDPFLEGVLQDVSLRKKREDELLRAKEKAEESDRMKTIFLTNLSHELRTPMNTIIGFSELINIGNIPPEKRKEYSRIIRSKGQQLLTLIDDIIEIAQFEAGRINLSVTPCDLNHLYGEVYQIAIERRRNLQKEAIQLKMDLPPVSSRIMTDPGRVQQVCLNLIENSLQYSEKGFIEFGYEVKDQKIIQCFVKDSGIGLKKEEQKNLFNRFKKVEETSLRKNSGSGMGLTLSKYIVQLLGGKIWVDSVFGEGSTFTFTLPNSPAPELELIQESFKEAESLGEFNWKNKVILLVEDDEINVQFIDAILSPYQVQLIHAPNGMQGVELCKSLPHIDLILMDIKMPEMSGYEACSEIKKIKPDIPIIAQTAFALRDDRIKCLEAGCNDYISKPIDINELLHKIQQYIN